MGERRPPPPKIERHAHGIVDAASKYLEAPEHLAELRKGARATAETFFDTRTISPVLDEVYDQAVQNGGRGCGL